MTPAQRVAAVLGACALAVPVIATYEGYVPKGYSDPVGIATACYGHTGDDAILGRVYTADQCAGLLAQDAIKHGLDIDQCLTRPIPEASRAAFISFAFNIGAAKFCSSSVARKANAGDLAGACAGLSAWVFAKGRILPGLVTRRKAERELCERGLQ